MSNFDVAPHGILIMAALALILVLVIHTLGFRALAAVKVGG